ncbi:MAG: phasin family protein [Desulfuromonadales bacterium]|nr:phasin family protein [Desulfuromonadales bacterium]
MIDLIEKTVLAGIGVLALSQKKAEELVDDLKKRFNLSEEEGRSLLDNLKKVAEENRQKLEEIARAEVEKNLNRLGLVSQKEFDALQKKVTQLAKRLKETG